MIGTISILSFDERTSKAALVGSFTGESAEFLTKHLGALPGDVVLECERLDDVDPASATALLEFRESRGTQGLRVFFRGIPPHCREALLAQVRRREGRRERANHPSAGRVSQLELAGTLTTEENLEQSHG
jgi:anti-anti-sigma regulatory factor